jgi:hypothetical protein
MNARLQTGAEAVEAITCHVRSIQSVGYFVMFRFFWSVLSQSWILPIKFVESHLQLLAFVGSNTLPRWGWELAHLASAVTEGNTAVVPARCWSKGLCCGGTFSFMERPPPSHAHRSHDCLRLPGLRLLRQVAQLDPFSTSLRQFPPNPRTRNSVEGNRR